MPNSCVAFGCTSGYKSDMTKKRVFRFPNGKKEPERFKSMEARFADQVYMGDKLITKLWELGGGEAIMQVENQDGKVILSQSKVTYEE